MLVNRSFRVSVLVSKRAAHALILGYVPWCHVVDMKHVYSAPFTAEAVVSRFFDTGNVSVHAWQPTSRPHYYALLQQVPLETQHATGSLEVVLTSSRVHEIQWRNYNFCPPPCKHSLHSIITVLIHNSGHFGLPLPFWAPGRGTQGPKTVNVRIMYQNC